MKRVNKYLDEISGREFKTQEEAIKSEKKHGGIKKLFSFWKEPKDNTCDFANGKWCYQRTEAEYHQLIEALVKGVKKYEPWIAKHYEKDGGLSKKHIGGGYIIGRFLNDGNSELYHHYGILSNICPKCFREYGQMFWAINCFCNGTVKHYSSTKDIPTKE